MPAIPAVFVIISSALSLAATITTLFIANHAVKIVEKEVVNMKETLSHVEAKTLKISAATKNFISEIQSL